MPPLARQACAVFPQGRVIYVFRSETDRQTRQGTDTVSESCSSQPLLPPRSSSPPSSGQKPPRSAPDPSATQSRSSTMQSQCVAVSGPRPVVCDRTFYYGDANDELLMGDWNCNGEQTPGTYRRSTGSVYLRNSNYAGCRRSHRSCSATRVMCPLSGDFNGDGCDTLGIYRPSEARFYISNTLDSGVASGSFALGCLR